MKNVDLQLALELLKNGDVVAIPTETVYGLGGWIHSQTGLEKIFSTKERPFFDPLIVHVDGIENARKLSANWTSAHQVLAEACWPGPLTIITKKKSDLNPLITSGLDSVGIRCPNHKIALELLSKIEGGIAAPSANKFGKTSPTTSAHVSAEFGDEVSILEGGASQIGIESTVAGIIEEGNSFKVEIYRPGFYTATMLQKILSDRQIEALVTYSESPVAPGQLKHHYMPRIPLVIIPENASWETVQAKIEKTLDKKFFKPVLWSQSSDPRIASRELYQRLREFDQQGFDIIVTAKNAHHQSEEWKGIWNRLEKAQTMTISD